MSVISGSVSAGLGYQASKEAAQIQQQTALASMVLQQQMFNQMMEITAPFREQELQRSTALTSNALAGPGEYKQTPGLQGFMDEMNKEFKYEQSPGLKEALEEATRATTRSGIAEGPGGATQAAVARGTAAMTYQDFLTQQSRFDTRQSAKANARLQDPQTQISNWYNTKIAPLSGGSPMTQQMVNTGFSTGQGMANTMMGAGNAMAAGQINAANAISGGLGSIGQGATNLLAGYMAGGGKVSSLLSFL